MAVANLVTVAIIVGVRYHLWRSNGISSRPHYRLSRLRSATFRPFPWAPSHSPPSTTDQYQLRTADTLYSRRIPGLRSDLLAPEIVHEQRQQCSHQQRQFSGGVVLCPPSHSQPPQYSQLPTNPQGPPPSYHQVRSALVCFLGRQVFGLSVSGGVSSLPVAEFPSYVFLHTQFFLSPTFTCLTFFYYL